MSNHLSIFSFLILVSGNIHAAEIRGNITRVLDGDTVEIMQDKTPVRVRLVNIDAPEKRQPFGYWSANQLKTLTAGKAVTVTYSQTDRYGRVLGHISTTNADINRTVVRLGAAWVYDRYNTDNALPALQRDARAQKRGLWADSQPVPPWEWRYRRSR